MFSQTGELIGTRSGYRSDQKQAFLEELENLVLN